MTLAAKLCEHETFVFNSLKKKETLLTAIMSTNMSHHQVTVQRWFWQRTEFQDCCLQVWLAVVFPQNKGSRERSGKL